jgi:hypothetical protein
MPKKSMRSRSRSRRGGIWPFDSDTQDSSSTGSSWYSNLNPFGSKKPEYGSTSNGMGMGMGMDNSQQPYNTGYGMGGKKGKRRRSMRGGYSDNISLNNLAATAEPISGVPTASASYVGGRTRRRRRHRHNKSCKHRKH